MALGDSTAHPDWPGFVELYAQEITKATGVPVEVDNRAAIRLSNLHAMQASQLRNNILTDPSLRDAIATADIVLVTVGHNDTPWNRYDDPCDASDVTATVVDWSRITDECVSRVLGDYKGTLDEIFTQIDILRGCWTPAGEELSCADRGHRDTMLRLATVYNDWIGYPGGSSEADAVTARVDAAWVDAQCWVVRMHGGECADLYHLLNGADGTSPARQYLQEDYTHLNPLGHHLVADELASLGFHPLR